MKAPTKRTLVCVAAAITTFGLVAGCSDDGPADPPITVDTPGTIRTWAGDGRIGWDGEGHTLLESSFYYPVDMTIAPDGETYILDWNNHRVRHLTAGGVLETAIGNEIGDGPLAPLSETSPPGAPGTTINLNHPTNFLPLPDGRFLLTTWHNHKLRVFDPATGLVTVTCGAGPGFAGDGGPAINGRLNQPCYTTIDTDGNLYVVDQRNQRIRKIATDGMISTVVGNGTPGFSGDGGPPLDAQIYMPLGPNPPPGGALAFDAQGRLYISDVLNHRIRRVDFQANTIETVAGNGTAGFGGDGGPAIAASLNNPRDIEIGPDGRLYVADELNSRIRVINLTGGTIDTFAGTGVEGFAGDGGPAREARLDKPTGIEFDPDGTHLFIVDAYNHRIRRVDL